MRHWTKSSWIFTIAIVLIHAFFYLLALNYKRFYNGDSFEYIQEAINLKNNCFFYSGNMALPITDEYKTLRTPAYPLFLLAIYAIVISNKLVLLVQNVISIINILYCRNILKNVFGYKERYSWLLLVFIAAFPSQFVYANTIAPDILLQTFVLVYFHGAILYLKRHSGTELLKMSLALSAGLFVKPVLYPFAFIHLVAIVLLFLNQKIKNYKLLPIASIPVLFIMAYSGWNMMRTGKYHFTSIQSFNAIYYYHNYYSNKQGPKQARHFLEEKRNEIQSKPTFRERYDEAHRIGIALLVNEFAPYMLFHLKKSALFFFETGKGELDLFTGKMTLGTLYKDNTVSMRQIIDTMDMSKILSYIRQQPTVLIALVVLLLNVVKVVGVLLFTAYGSADKLTKWFVGLFMAYFALITGPISNAHYVLPISLIISGLAITGIVSFLQRKKNNAIITQ